MGAAVVDGNKHGDIGTSTSGVAGHRVMPGPNITERSKGNIINLATPPVPGAAFALGSALALADASFLERGLGLRGVVGFSVFWLAVAPFGSREACRLLSIVTCKYPHRFPKLQHSRVQSAHTERW